MTSKDRRVNSLCHVSLYRNYVPSFPKCNRVFSPRTGTMSVNVNRVVFSTRIHGEPKKETGIVGLL